MNIKKKYFFSAIVVLAASIIFSSIGVDAAFNSVMALNSVKKWCILLDYDESNDNSNLNLTDLPEHDLVILDADSHPSLKDIQDSVILIAYLSVGEAEDYREYWKRIAGKEWVLNENPNWEGNYYVDIRNDEWHRLVLEEIVPNIMEKGFDGLMLDTLDTVDILSGNSAKDFQGANEAMIELVREIHEKYPKLYLISNNGFSILEEIAPYLSGILVEDIHMMIDFEKNNYKKVPEQDRNYKINLLKGIASGHNLSVFNIDYAPQGDRKLINKCIRKSRQLGYKPYVAERDLNKIYKN